MYQRFQNAHAIKDSTTVVFQIVNSAISDVQIVWSVQIIALSVLGKLETLIIFIIKSIIMLLSNIREQF